MPPRVSIVVPCYNEQATIRQLLEALFQQTFPYTEMEVVIADGLSQDGTRDKIISFQQEHPGLAIRVVENVARTIPSAVNSALRASRGDIIVRLDAHSRPFPNYVERCLSALEAGLGDNVGGVWQIEPGGNGWIAKSIAVAAAHPFGVGDAGYRLGRQASLVDTVPFGAFQRSLLDRIGLFDESLHSNEDYEFNARIRKSGGRVWLDPEIVTVYYARSTLRELARQYWRYGYWKFRMLRRNPDTLRWRQALPPLFVASLGGLALLVWWVPARWLVSLELAVYVMVLLVAGLLSAIRHRIFLLVIGLPLSIAIMHLAWGGGFLWSLIMSILKNPKNG
jgi:cellulose synthase/poly-beta-1,6-N-acetylglucosamine synthase-like glycosyltransferase